MARPPGHTRSGPTGFPSSSLRAISAPPRSHRLRSALLSSRRWLPDTCKRECPAQILVIGHKRQVGQHSACQQVSTQIQYAQQVAVVAWPAHIVHRADILPVQPLPRCQGKRKSPPRWPPAAAIPQGRPQSLWSPNPADTEKCWSPTLLTDESHCLDCRYAHRQTAAGSRAQVSSFPLHSC